jgi:nucleotide-binding universal stress UspA family protein
MYKNILLTVDVTDESSWEKALPTALEFCKVEGSTLHLLSVVPDFGMTVVGGFFPDNYENGAIAQATKDLKEIAAKNVPEGIEVKLDVAYGNIYEEILEVAAKVGIDLIVIASHRPQLKDYLLGPNAARVVRHAKCSVLVVRD